VGQSTMEFSNQTSTLEEPTNGTSDIVPRRNDRGGVCPHPAQDAALRGTDTLPGLRRSETLGLKRKGTNQSLHLQKVPQKIQH